MTVLVCSHDAEPIDGYLRANWMRECLPQAGYRVLHMHRDIPQAPEDHPDFWPIWRDAIAEFHPEPIDWVFGSEEYIHRLARELRARPFPVDPDREVVPVSATAIRVNSWSYWDYVPSPVRGYCQRRLVLVGAESTGKTALSEVLATRLNSVPIPEYGREYDAIFRHGQSWLLSDFEEIMAGHKALADTMAKRGGPVVIEDTDAVQTLVWAEVLLGKVTETLVNQARTAVAGKSYLLLDHQTPWHDDGTRYFADTTRRAFFTQRLSEWLNTFKADWQLIQGEDWAARTAAASARLDAVDAFWVSHAKRFGHHSG
ncbi:AAA family ATPase [Sulfitobacter sp. TBRI5]|uniref:AAA family ATPase n=1 Tax=Sulfitobacter sp. TBRI5 TaxID=2989732 RepID=UPI003D9BC250